MWHGSSNFVHLILVNFAACAFGVNWQKSWLLACSYISMTSLGTKCEHGINAHEIIAGQSADGSFRSRKTSEYPQAMCLCISTATVLDLQAALTLIPKKGLTDFPISYEDGGGLHSQPDWSSPYRQEENMFQHLRKSWIDRIFDQRLHLKFLRFLQADDSSPPLSDEDIQPFRDILSQFLTERGRTASWEIREDQGCIYQSCSSFHIICMMQIGLCFPAYKTEFPQVLIKIFLHLRAFLRLLTRWKMQCHYQYI